MYTNLWINQLTESYIDIKNENINLTEEDLHFYNLCLIVESIENTFGIELTEKEIAEIDNQLQLNEFIVPAFKIGLQLAKKGITKGMQKAGTKLMNNPAYNKARQAAIKQADDDYAKAIDAWKKGGGVGDVPIPGKPVMPERGVAAKVGGWMVKNAPTAPKSAVKAAGYAGLGTAIGVGARDVLGFASTLATGYWPKEPKDKKGRSGAVNHSTEEESDYEPAKTTVGSMTPRGGLPPGSGGTPLVGKKKPSSGPSSGGIETVPPHKRGGRSPFSASMDDVLRGKTKLLPRGGSPVGFSRTGSLPPAITDSVMHIVNKKYITEMTLCATNAIESIYEVELTEEDINIIAYNIGKQVL